MDATFTLRNLQGSLKKYRVVLAFIAVAAAALLLLSAVVGQGAAALANNLSRDSAVSTVRVLSDSSTGPAVQLTRERLDELAAVPHVKSVDTWAQQGMMPEDSSLWSDSGTPSVFWATPRIAYAQPKIVATLDGADPALRTIGTSDVVLPNEINGKNLKAALGRSFVFSYTLATGASSGIDQTLELRVVGLFDNSVPGSDGTTAAYVHPSVEDRLIAARLGLAGAAEPGHSYAYPAAYVDVDSAANVAKVQSALANSGYNVSSIAAQVTQLPGLLHMLSLLNPAIAVVLALFCLGAGISIGSAWLAQRGREIGLLRALGWTRGRVFRSLIGEICAAGLTSAVSGVALGFLCTFVASRLVASQSILGIEFAATMSIPAWYWFAGIVVGLPLALALGAIRPLARLSRVAPDDALRQL